MKIVIYTKALDPFVVIEVDNVDVSKKYYICCVVNYQKYIKNEEEYKDLYSNATIEPLGPYYGVTGKEKYISVVDEEYEKSLLKSETVRYVF